MAFYKFHIIKDNNENNKKVLILLFSLFVYLVL